MDNWDDAYLEMWDGLRVLKVGLRAIEDPLNRLIFILRWEGQTLQTIAAVCHLTRERIRQLHLRAIKQFRAGVRQELIRSGDVHPDRNVEVLTKLLQAA